MNCRKVNHLLSAYMDGELPGIEHRLICHHLARCPECQEEYQSLLQLKHMLSGMQIKEPSKSLPTTILQEISNEEVRAAERSPAALLRHLQSSVSRPLTYTHLIGFGASLAIVGFLLSTQVALSSNSSQSGITFYADLSRDTPPPPADELTRGLDPAGSMRFVGQPVSNYRTAWDRIGQPSPSWRDRNRSPFARPTSSPIYRTVDWDSSH